MDGRKLGTGLMVLASSFLLLVGTASAHGTVGAAGTEGEGSCTVKSLPSFIAQGEFENAASVGDIIEVSCDPYVYSQGAEVTLTASQLYSRCHEISWYDPNDYGRFIWGHGRSFSVHLDVDGNANVGLIAGPNCMVGESLITLDENESPYETFTTSFQVLPAVNTPQGLYVTPSSQVEDAESSAVITIVQAEFSHASEQYVRLGYGQLYDRCERGLKAKVIKADRYLGDRSRNARGDRTGQQRQRLRSARRKRLLRRRHLAGRRRPRIKPVHDRNGHVHGPASAGEVRSLVAAVRAI